MKPEKPEKSRKQWRRWITGQEAGTATGERHAAHEEKKEDNTAGTAEKLGTHHPYPPQMP